MNHFPNQNTNLRYPPETTDVLNLLNIASPTPAQSAEANGIQQKSRHRGFFRNAVLKRFEQLQGGQFTLIESEGRRSFGQAGNDHLSASIWVNDPQFYQQVLLGGTIGAAESYLDGRWGCDRLTDLIRIMIRNMDTVSQMEKTWAKLRSTWHRIRHFRRRNTVQNSRKNIQDHYDLGNDFYRLFLDPTMNYSAGIFDSDRSASDFPDATSPMHAASLVKMDHICQKLDLRPNDHVIEIGTGWGGLAVFMAKKYGCRVTTTTISDQQYQYATAAVAEQGLENKVTVLNQDYRTLEGKFDKLVSIEMIEAVGHRFLDTYFGQCSQLLKPDGAMLIQAITIAEQQWRDYQRGADFIRAYVFPGGCLPSVGSISASIGRSTDMRMVQLEDMSQHYADTLMHWRRDFMRRMPEVRELGFDDHFIRLWHFYLCYCEAAFAERRCNSIQVTFAKSKSLTDPVMVGSHNVNDDSPSLVACS